MNLNELRKSTIQSFIKGREQQADSAWDNSQIAKKAWLGNSRKTGIWDPVVPRVVGQIGKIGQHDDALLRTATIFDKRSEQAKASANKAKLRLSGKRANTMQNEEYTQVLEQMILTLTGMELKELHEAVVGHLSEDWQTPAREKTMNAKLSKTDTDWQKKINASYAKHSRLHNSLEKGYHKIKNQIEKEKGSSKVYGKGGKIVKGYTSKTK